MFQLQLLLSAMGLLFDFLLRHHVIELLLDLGRRDGWLGGLTETAELDRV